MKWLLFVPAAILLSGCALTHEQVVARAKQKSDAQLCMALIQFPQYSNEVEAELQERGRTCDMQLAAAQVNEQHAQNARYQAALQSAAASMSANQPSYQIVPPVQLASQRVGVAPMTLQTAATAYFTGQQRQVQTVTYQMGWNCQYQYAAQTFWRTFVGTCPVTVQVQ